MSWMRWCAVCRYGRVMPMLGDAEGWGVRRQHEFQGLVSATAVSLR
jgi:hypothetical protein